MSRTTQFLRENASAGRVVIYASAPHVLVHGVLAPLNNLNPPDFNSLDQNFPTTDRSWVPFGTACSGGVEEGRVTRFGFKTR